MAFEQAYQQRWGEALQAGHGPAPSYESVYILAEAIERAGSLDPDAITAELQKTDRNGVMGRLVFDEGHQAVYDMDPSTAAGGGRLPVEAGRQPDHRFPHHPVRG